MFLFYWLVTKLYVEVFFSVTPCFKEKLAWIPGNRIPTQTSILFGLPTINITFKATG